MREVNYMKRDRDVCPRSHQLAKKQYNESNKRKEKEPDVTAVGSFIKTNANILITPVKSMVRKIIY